MVIMSVLKKTYIFGGKVSLLFYCFGGKIFGIKYGKEVHLTPFPVTENLYKP